MLKLAVNLRWLFQEWTAPKRYAAAASIGIKGVEMPNPYETPAKELAQTLRENDLTMVQIATPADWANGVLGQAAVPGRTSEFIDGIHAAIEYAAQIGRPRIHVLLGAAPPDVRHEHAMDLLTANLAKAADAAAMEHITLTIEPVCRRDWALHRLSETQDILKAVGRDNLKLVFDTYHVQMEEGRLTERLAANFSQIGVIQIGNPPGRHEPGAGELDLFFFIKEVERLGWDDWISCEYIPSAGTLGSLAWTAQFGVSISDCNVARA